MKFFVFYVGADPRVRQKRVRQNFFTRDTA